MAGQQSIRRIPLGKVGAQGEASASSDGLTTFSDIRGEELNKPQPLKGCDFTPTGRKVRNLYRGRNIKRQETLTNMKRQLGTYELVVTKNTDHYENTRIIGVRFFQSDGLSGKMYCYKTNIAGILPGDCVIANPGSYAICKVVKIQHQLTAGERNCATKLITGLICPE